MQEAMWELNRPRPLTKVDSRIAIKVLFPRIGAEVPMVFVLEVKGGLKLRPLQLAQSRQLMGVQMVGEATVEAGQITRVVGVDREVLGQISPRGTQVQVP